MKTGQNIRAQFTCRVFKMLKVVWLKWQFSHFLLRSPHLCKASRWCWMCLACEVGSGDAVLRLPEERSLSTQDPAGLKVVVVQVLIAPTTGV